MPKDVEAMFVSFFANVVYAGIIATLVHYQWYGSAAFIFLLVLFNYMKETTRDWS